jgi:hypothetical protein
MRKPTRKSYKKEIFKVSIKSAIFSVSSRLSLLNIIVEMQTKDGMNYLTSL